MNPSDPTAGSVRCRVVQPAECVGAGCDRCGPEAVRLVRRGTQGVGDAPVGGCGGGCVGPRLGRAGLGGHPLLVAASAFGHDGGQQPLGRCADRRWGRQPGGDVGCQALAHRPPHLRAQLGCADEELPGRERQVVGDPAHVGRRGPAGELGRHGCSGAALGGHPLADDDGAGGQVAEALGPAVAQRAEQGRDPQQQPDLDDLDERADQRVPEARRPAVVAHDAQPEGVLAGRPAPAHGLPDQGVAHEDADDEDE